jgi:hypothetical protein
LAAASGAAALDFAWALAAGLLVAGAAGVAGARGVSGVAVDIVEVLKTI